MRTTLLVMFITFFTFSITHAQTVEGGLKISGIPRDGKISEAVPVDIFKSFKENKYKISFSYKANKDSNRGIVLFDMKTTLKKDGKTISTTTRKNWPWLPGDMYVPIEAFDLIPSLQSVASGISRSSLSSPLPKGKYEVVLEMKPAGNASGSIKPVNFNFIIN